MSRCGRELSLWSLWLQRSHGSRGDICPCEGLQGWTLKCLGIKVWTAQPACRCEFFLFGFGFVFFFFPRKVCNPITKAEFKWKGPQHWSRRPDYTSHEAARPASLVFGHRRGPESLARVGAGPGVGGPARGSFWRAGEDGAAVRGEGRPVRSGPVPGAAMDTGWESDHLWLCLLALGFHPKCHPTVRLGRWVLGRCGGGRGSVRREGLAMAARGPVPLGTWRAREMPAVPPPCTLSQTVWRNETQEWCELLLPLTVLGGRRGRWLPSACFENLPWKITLLPELFRSIVDCWGIGLDLKTSYRSHSRPLAVGQEGHLPLDPSCSRLLPSWFKHCQGPGVCNLRGQPVPAPHYCHSKDFFP